MRALPSNTTDPGAQRARPVTLGQGPMTTVRQERHIQDHHIKEAWRLSGQLREAHLCRKHAQPTGALLDGLQYDLPTRKPVGNEICRHLLASLRLQIGQEKSADKALPTAQTGADQSNRKDKDKAWLAGKDEKELTQAGDQFGAGSDAADVGRLPANTVNPAGPTVPHVSIESGYLSKRKLAQSRFLNTHPLSSPVQPLVPQQLSLL